MTKDILCFMIRPNASHIYDKNSLSLQKNFNILYFIYK